MCSPRLPLEQEDNYARIPVNQIEYSNDRICQKSLFSGRASRRSAVVGGPKFLRAYLKFWRRNISMSRATYFTLKIKKRLEQIFLTTVALSEKKIMPSYFIFLGKRKNTSHECGFRLYTKRAHTLQSIYSFTPNTYDFGTNVFVVHNISIQYCERQKSLFRTICIFSV
jgi:hypothetical protein